VPNRNYQQGYRYEIIERNRDRRKGMYSVRMHASKGDFDVISTDGTTVWFKEVKSYTKKRGSYKTSLAKLRRVPKGPNVIRQLVVYGPKPKSGARPRKVKNI